MLPLKPRWVLMACAVLGCSPLLKAATPPDAASDRPQLPPEVRVAGAPIPQSADARTSADFMRRYLDWHSRILLPPFKAAAKGQPWESEAVKFVEDSLPAWLGFEQEDKAQPLTALAARGAALVKSGCNEPTVLFLAARFAFNGSRDREEVGARYRLALNKLEADRRYPSCFACIVAVNLSGMLEAPSAALNQEILKLRRAAVEEGSYSGPDAAFLVDQVLNTYDPLRGDLDATEKLATETKGLAEWARDTILGNIEIARGWKARGDGDANAVSEEQSKEYRHWLDKAREHLETAWKLRPDEPYAAADMIRVAMDSGPGSAESARQWFDRTVLARFDYLSAYSAYRFSLLPRWGGTYQQMLVFGLACTATERYDTDVPREFNAILYDIAGDGHELRGVFEIPQIAGALVTVDKRYIAAAKQSGERNVLISNLVLDAWLGRQWDDAKKALDQVPDRKLHPDTLRRMSYFGVEFSEVVGEILINTSAAKEEYSKAKELEKQGRYAEASTAYKTVLKTAGDEQPVKELIGRLTKIATAREELEKGQWTEISPKTSASSGWTFPKTARWSFPEKGALVAEGLGGNTVSRWRTPVGENYELRATFEFLSPEQGLHRFAIVLGMADRHPDQAILCNFFVPENLPKGMVRLLRGFDAAGNPDYPVEFQKQNRVLIQCWHGRLNLYLNGKAVFENVQSLEGNPSDHDGEIGFGAYQLPQKESFRVTDVAVRVLKAAPTPPE